MYSFDPKTLPTKDLHQHILAAVSPRPIAFVSTISADGVPNLAPYSFFNAFSSNPPILVFSSNRRVGNNTTKDTLHNVEATGEAVINTVNYSIVQQMAIASVEYPPEVSEFEKAGFTPLASDLVKPFRVKESPIQMECKVEQIIPLGDKGGAGHLIICHIVRMHISEDILDERGRINPWRLDAVARLGRAYYARINGEMIFPLHQPVDVQPVGYDGLPQGIKESRYLTAFDLASIAALPQIPTAEEISAMRQSKELEELFNDFSSDPQRLYIELHAAAKGKMDSKEVTVAFVILMLAEEIRSK